MIRTRRELDREVRELYQLVVEVRDHGEEPLAATTSLEVMVLDEIDYSPVFSQVSRQLLHLLVRCSTCWSVLGELNSVLVRLGT